MLGTFYTNGIGLKAARVKQGAATKCQHPCDNKASTCAAVARGSKPAPQDGECRVDLESLADVLSAVVANRPADNKASTCAAVAQGSRRALQDGEYFIDLESLADVLGAVVANVILSKTARADQGATTTTKCERPCGQQCKHIFGLGRVGLSCT
eukprot:scaffold4613_cov129-Isochrysis_galbana.AAC.12